MLHISNRSLSQLALPVPHCNKSLKKNNPTSVRMPERVIVVLSVCLSVCHALILEEKPECYFNLLYECCRFRNSAGIPVLQASIFKKNNLHRCYTAATSYHSHNICVFQDQLPLELSFQPMAPPCSGATTCTLALRYKKRTKTIYDSRVNLEHSYCSQGL